MKLPLQASLYLTHSHQKQVVTISLIWCPWSYNSYTAGTKYHFFRYCTSLELYTWSRTMAKYKPYCLLHSKVEHFSLTLMIFIRELYSHKLKHWWKICICKTQHHQKIIQNWHTPDPFVNKLPYMNDIATSTQPQYDLGHQDVISS